MSHQQKTQELDTQYDEEALPESMQPNVICPHCAHAMTELDHLCPNCGGPVTAHAMIDPMSRIYSMGYCARRFSPDTTKPIFVIGVWLILGPSMLFCALLVFITIRQFLYESGWDFASNTTFQLQAKSRTMLLFQCLLFLSICLWNLQILVKMTRAMLRRRRTDARGHSD
jgi:hypothetical protein